MSISIDGKVHQTTLQLKYGQEFPKQYSNRDVHIEGYGNAMIYIIHVDTPEWGENFTVKVRMKYYITQIYDDEFKVGENKVIKKNKLYLVKG